MTCFSGILNINGREYLITIYLDLNYDEVYETCMFIENRRCTAIITSNTIQIDGIDYNYSVNRFDDEIIINGQEHMGCTYNMIKYCCFWNCFTSNNYRFFLITNKI